MPRPRDAQESCHLRQERQEGPYARAYRKVRATLVPRTALTSLVLVVQAWAQTRLYRAGRYMWMPTDKAGVSH